MVTPRAATGGSYAATAKALHWLTVLGLIVMFVTGFWIQDLEATDPLKETLRGVHRSTGLSLALITLFRVLYRITHEPPRLPADMPHWQAEIARTIQWLFYGMLLFMPAVGWGYANAAAQTVHFWWLFNLPVISGTDQNTLLLLDWAHEYGGQFFMILAALHLAGALYHGLVKQDGVLTAMLPGGR
jgi:cytochrome b561